MQITFNTYTMHLEDEPLDVGYASEKVNVTDAEGKEIVIGGHNGATQLIVSLPFLDDTVSSELQQIATTLHNSPLIDASVSLVFADAEDAKNAAGQGFTAYVDNEGEFRDMYSTRLVDGPLDGKLAKALFIISKDGAIFYDEFATDILKPFDADKAISKLAVAQECYTGKGCH